MAVLATGAAVLFKRDAPRSSSAALNTDAEPTSRHEYRSRGSIVPLPSDEPHAAAAFLAAPGRERSTPAVRDEGPRMLDGVPTIRRQGPQLQRAYPTPLGLLGIDTGTPEPEDVAPNSNKTDARSRPAATAHTIVDGDTLPALAQLYFGDAGRAADIYAANRAVLNSPDLLPISVEIVIPASSVRRPSKAVEGRTD